MKKKTILTIVGMGILLLIISVFFFMRLRKTTSIEITSIAPITTSSTEIVRVGFKVFGGAEDFSVVVLPDTQHYSEKYHDLYFAQTQWIAQNKQINNIVFVSHLGDIVQNNDYFEEEWKIADTAMSTLDGFVPYGILPGNHDMQFGGTAEFYTYYFPASRFSENTWWGGSFNENKNNFQLISAAGDEYIFLHLQYCPPDSAIKWANGVLSDYAERKAIISTHSYLFDDKHRVGHCQEKSDGENSGFDIWKKVVRQNKNIFLVLSGHIPGAFRRVDHVDGRVVYQLLSDYQGMSNGGNGYLRIMNFQPNLDNIHVTTYSPNLDSFLIDENNEFDISFDMSGGRLPSGLVTISNGSGDCSASVEKGYCDLEISDESTMEFSAKYSGDLFFKSSNSP